MFGIVEPRFCQLFGQQDLVDITEVVDITEFDINFLCYRISINGGVVSVAITWNCNLDTDFMEYCLPRYSFRILDDFGWNFRHAKYHEEHRRSLYKMYGIKVKPKASKTKVGYC